MSRKYQPHRHGLHANEAAVSLGARQSIQRGRKALLLRCRCRTRAIHELQGPMGGKRRGNYVSNVKREQTTSTGKQIVRALKNEKKRHVFSMASVLYKLFAWRNDYGLRQIKNTLSDRKGRVNGWREQVTFFLLRPAELFFLFFIFNCFFTFPIRTSQAYSAQNKCSVYPTFIVMPSPLTIFYGLNIN